MRTLKIEEKLTQRSDTVSRYFVDLNRHDRISLEKEVELANRVAQGDSKAVDELVKANLRFVVSVAKQYAKGADDFSELIAQGNIGLIDAAKTFDASRGFKFISYAVWHIRKEILQYLQSQSRMVRLPSNITLNLSRAKKAEVSLRGKLDRDPEIWEVVEEMQRMGWDCSIEKLQMHQLAVQPVSRLEKQSDEEWCPLDWLSSEDHSELSIELKDKINSLNWVLAKLPSRNREIVRLRHGLVDQIEWSFAAIGEKYGKTAEWARTQYNKSIRVSRRFSSKIKV